MGIGATAPPTVFGGLFVNIYPGAVNRGRAVMFVAFMTNLGLITGPIVSGFVAERGWKWMFWISLILTTTIWPFLIFLPDWCITF